MTIVSDTSPINYLILTDSIEILHTLYRRILIPPAVYAELRNPDAPEQVSQWVSNLPNWVEIRALPVTDSTLDHLDPGEQEVIALSIEIQADEVLIDERRGRRAAEMRGLVVTGTLGILELAAKRGLIDLPQVLARLQRTSFRVATEMIDLLLERDAARRQAE